MRFEPIGIIHSPFTTTEGMPIQPAGARDVRGTVEIDPRYRDGLADLDGFSHLILLYHFHRSEGFALKVVPFMDTAERGLFATRAPRRPNPIGLSVVALEKVADGVLHIRGVDVLDGTPLVDIKPWVPAFDQPADVRTGWLEETAGGVGKKRADERFL